MNTKPYDQAFKYLVEQDAESLLILLGALKPGEQADIELLPREISVAATLPDQPFRISRADREEIAHVEAQTYWEAAVPDRMADYALRLWLKYQRPITSYVLLLTRHGLPKPAPRLIRVDGGDLSIRLRFRLIRLWQIAAREVLAMQRESLLPFVPLMNGGRRELEESVELLRRVRDERDRREASLHFLMLGGLRYNRTDLLDLIGRKNMIPLEQLKESSFYQFILEEGLKEGREAGLKEGLKEGLREGLREGREEGREEGELKGVRDILALLAGSRFPGADFAPELALIGDIEGLKKLTLELHSLPDADTLRERLRALASGAQG